MPETKLSRVSLELPSDLVKLARQRARLDGYGNLTEAVEELIENWLDGTNVAPPKSLPNPIPVVTAQQPPMVAQPRPQDPPLPNYSLFLGNGGPPKPITTLTKSEQIRLGIFKEDSWQTPTPQPQIPKDTDK